MKVRHKGGEKEEEKKKSDEGKNENERPVVVVGMKMDAQSREILTWALVKVAQPGDLVMGLHVLPSSSFSSDGKSSSDSALKAFNSVIAAYDDFCNLNQINLSFSICHGSSARKAIVREVERFQASELVLGASNHSHGIGTASTSFARYCSNKLSDDCTVVAINNGKVVFRREAKVEASISKGRKLGQSSSRNSLTVVDGSGDNSFCLLPASKYGREVHHSSSKKPIILEASNDSAFCLLPTRKYGSEEHRSSSKKPMFLEASNDNSFCVLPPRKIGRSNVNLAKVKVSPSTRKNKKPEDSCDAPRFKEEGQVYSRNSENTHQFLSALLRTSSEGKKRGWPRLRREEMYNKSNSVEKPKSSVVQWALRLPSRYSSVATTVHSCQQPETMAKERFDSSSRETIPLGMDGPCDSSDATNDEGSPKLQKELEDLHEKYGSTCRLFNYQELVDATSNFSPDNLIGKGGNSRVYKGVLHDNQEVAVKILKKSQEALEEFATEIEIIASLHHRNIISLSGFCFNSKNLMLVYNFLSRGSLGDNLHGSKKSENPIGWVDRFKIAVGIAEALEYLHSHGGESAPPVIHGDVKSSNILLSDDFHPQLSDFGLATWCGSPASSDTPRSDVAGTFGYLAPEYLMLGKVSEKIDVYAFGVVLLELLSGRMPIENEHLKGQQSLVMWAKPILRSGEFMKLLDQYLGSVYDEDQAERMILAASLCITRAPRLRPRMVTVLEILRGNNEELLKWAKLQVNDAWGEMEVLDDDESVMAYSPAEFQSHLNLALLDVEDDDDLLSVSSVDQTLDFIMSHVSLEAYLQDRRTSSTSFI